MKKEQALTISLHELNIVRLYAQPNNYQQIADKLFISIHTVRTHLHNVRKKCKLPMRAVIYWLTKGGVI
jgi:DNA-binding CsgD family transcriptional regulator